MTCACGPSCGANPAHGQHHGVVPGYRCQPTQHLRLRFRFRLPAIGGSQHKVGDAGRKSWENEASHFSPNALGLLTFSLAVTASPPGLALVLDRPAGRRT